jgi:hypothetical protein
MPDKAFLEKSIKAVEGYLMGRGDVRRLIGEGSDTRQDSSHFFTAEKTKRVVTEWGAVWEAALDDHIFFLAARHYIDMVSFPFLVRICINQCIMHVYRTTLYKLEAISGDA